MDTDEDQLAWGAYMYVWVALDISKPLLHEKKFDVGTNHSYYIRFSYERLPIFHYSCGCLGHNFMECSWWKNLKNMVDSQCLLYGQWLRAETNKSLEPFTDGPIHTR